MPSEPNPNLDKLLREYAKKRRDQAGAPAEIHPATRKMLQGEVARTFGTKTSAPSEEPQPKFFWGSRLAWLAGVAVVIVIGLVSIHSFVSRESPSKTMSLVANKAVTEKPALEPRPAAAPVPLPESAPAPVAETVDALTAPPSSPTSPAKMKTFATRQIGSLDDEARRRADKDLVTGTNSFSVASAAATGASIIKRDEHDNYVSVNGGAVSGSIIMNSSAANATLGAKLPADRLEQPKSVNWPTSVVLDSYYAYSEKEKFSGAGNNDPGRTFARAPAESRLLLKESATTNFVAVAPSGVAAPSSRAAGFDAAKPQAPGGNIAGQAGALTQNFRQQNLRTNLRENLQSPPQINVLSNFEIVWNDSQLKIIDADGSIYEGAIEPEPATFAKKSAKIGARAKEEAKAKQMADSFKDQPREGQSVKFRVKGQNRTLNREIVFEGTTFVAPQVAISGAFAKPAVPASQQSEKSQISTDKNPAPASPSQNTIRGYVNVGGTNEFKIEAVETR